MDLELLKKDLTKRWKATLTREGKVYWKQFRDQIEDGTVRTNPLTKEDYIEIYNNVSAWKERIDAENAAKKANKTRRIKIEEEVE